MKILDNHFHDIKNLFFPNGEQDSFKTDIALQKNITDILTSIAPSILFISKFDNNFGEKWIKKAYKWHRQEKSPKFPEFYLRMDCRSILENLDRDICQLNKSLRSTTEESTPITPMK